MRRLWLTGMYLVILGVGLNFAACGDGRADPDKSRTLNLVIATSDLAVGQQRLSYVLLDDDVPITEKTTFVRFYKNVSSPRIVAQGAIPWTPIGAEEAEHSGGGHTETELSGIYYLRVEFDEPGTWGIGVTVGDKPNEASEVRVTFDVKDKSDAPVIGQKVTPISNPVAGEKPMKQLHTGAEPDPQFHTLSVAKAIASGRPSVVVIATPSFCRTRTCGPALQVATKAQIGFGDRVNFLHIEPYELDADGNLAEAAHGNPFVVTEIGTAWNLQTEPWVFVLDESGFVRARFEGPYALEELESALEHLTGKRP